MFKQKSETPVTTPRSEPVDAVQQARTRARHRLIGAIVLLAVGVIGFPLVFETQPRPIPVDIPIEIPRRDAMPPLAMPSAPAAVTTASSPAKRRAEAVVTESAADAGRDVTPLSRAASSPASAVVRPAEPSRRTAAASAAASTPPATRAVTPAPPSGTDGERARALLEGRSAPSTAADGQRFVVQVGAFADAEAAREARKRIEKLGLKTYTQVAQTASGSRIRVRVGPFATRAEAEAAVTKAKAASLSAVVLTL